MQTLKDKFIEKATIAHKGRYDYSKVEYINSKTKIEIICHEHGSFWQAPCSHTRGIKCPSCAGNTKVTTPQWIDAAIQVHGDRYDYAKANYVNARTKIIIVCKEHGEFEQIPNSHLAGMGCKKCGDRFRGDLGSSNSEEFVKKAKLIHGDLYVYSKVTYTNNKTKVTIICPTHGEFEQSAGNHLAGNGCPKCKTQKTLKSQNQVIEDFIKVHGTIYDYSKVEYKTSMDKVTIICPVHGDFEQTPNSHVSGSGCPECRCTGFNMNGSGILYYLKITTAEEQSLYKIGITNRSVEQRFSLRDLRRIEIVSLKEFENGKDAYDEEQRILKQYKRYQYKGPDVLKDGNTELFTEDVLKLDN